MKAIGVVRSVDELGRVVLPIELRRIFDIQIKDPIEIYSEGNTIVLKKHKETCYLCGGDRGLKVFREKNICDECIMEIQNF